MMAQAKRKEQQKDAQDILKASLEKLEEHTQKYLSSKYGFSKDFLKQIEDIEAVREICEKSMETLATEFVEQLSIFQTTTFALEALQALESAESIWQAETKVINHFDQEGNEKTFLQGVRQQNYLVLNNKLEDTARECKRHPNEENIALCIAILSVMDRILHEEGQSVESPDRKRFRSIANSFR